MMLGIILGLGKRWSQSLFVFSRQALSVRQTVITKTDSGAASWSYRQRKGKLLNM
jgi:hypothetical protein